MSRSGAIKSPYLTVEEAAEFLRISAATLYRWMGMKRMKIPVRYHGKRAVFMIEELLAWSNEKNGMEMKAAV